MVNFSSSSAGLPQNDTNTVISPRKINANLNEEMNNTEYPTHDVQQDANILDGKNDEQLRKVPYTMHGVLHYLQHEWSRYEMDRAQWEMERAELQARISFLQGERKGQENLKADLIRRIKMLEYSLKQERAKNYRLTHNGQDKSDGEVSSDETAPASNEQVSLDVDAYVPQCNSASSFRNARALLRQYLQEIGYSEAVLDVRSFRSKNLLGIMPSSDWQNDSNSASRQNVVKALQDTDRAVMDAAQYLRKNKGDKLTSAASDDSDSEEDEKRRKGHKKDSLDPETVDALGEFSFLKEEKTSAKKRVEVSGEWSVDQRAIDQMKEKFRSEQERKRSNSQSESSSSKGISQARVGLEITKKEVPTDEIQQYIGGKGKREFIDINAALGIADETSVDIKDNFVLPEEDTTNIRWNLKFTLRSHFDSIRAMQFHPVEPVLITASEDSTAKLWNLGTGNIKVDAKGSQISPHSSSAVTELEPIYTFRGHSGPILSMDMSPTGDMCYTGGFDGVVCCWSVPSVNTDIYEPYDPKVLCEKLRGHSSAIWSVAFHSSDNRLVSASADGTIKLWEPGNAEALIKTFGAAMPNLKPTSVDFVSTEPQQLLAAYTFSYASIIDIETSRTVLSFDFGDDAGTITKILSHPTMPVTMTASNDRKIRYFDNNTGKMIHGNVAHVEAISCLAVDPNGLYLLSGSHDGSLRLWNMEKRVCLQEIAAHRKKFDSAVMTVAFHSSRPLIGSAGADALAKVFSSQKYLHPSCSES